MDELRENPVLPAAILAHLRAAISNGKGVLKRNVDNFLAAEVSLHSRSARSRLHSLLTGRVLQAPPAQNAHAGAPAAASTSAHVPLAGIARADNAACPPAVAPPTPCAAASSSAHAVRRPSHPCSSAQRLWRRTCLTCSISQEHGTAVAAASGAAAAEPSGSVLQSHSADQPTAPAPAVVRC